MIVDGEELKENAGSTAGPDTLSHAKIERLLKQHYSGLHLLLQRKVRDPHTASDLLNGAIAKTLEHLQANRISNVDQIAGWVFRVALNDLNNHRRNMNTRGAVRDGEELLPTLRGEGDASDGVAESKIASLVREVIEQLPTERDRAIIKRFYLDEADKETICREHNGLSALHFDRVIHRARQRMREIMEKKGLKLTDFFLMLCAV